MENRRIWISFILLLLMYVVQGENDVSYDSSVTTEASLIILSICFFTSFSVCIILFIEVKLLQCLMEPWKPHYNGGLLKNPGFDDGVSGWILSGRGIMEERVSSTGNRFIVARNRSRPLDSFTQNVMIDKGNLYSFSGMSSSNEYIYIIVCAFF